MEAKKSHISSATPGCSPCVTQLHNSWVLFLTCLKKEVSHFYKNELTTDGDTFFNRRNAGPSPGQEQPQEPEQAGGELLEQLCGEGPGGH